MWRKESDLEDKIFKLTGIDVYAANNQHIVGAPDDLLDAPHGPRRRGEEASEITRPITDDWQCLLGERCEHEFAERAVGDRGPRFVDR